MLTRLRLLCCCGRLEFLGRCRSAPLFSFSLSAQLLRPRGLCLGLGLSLCGFRLSFLLARDLLLSSRTRSRLGLCPGCLLAPLLGLCRDTLRCCFCRGG